MRRLSENPGASASRNILGPVLTRTFVIFARWRRRGRLVEAVQGGAPAYLRVAEGRSLERIATVLPSRETPPPTPTRRPKPGRIVGEGLGLRRADRRRRRSLGATSPRSEDKDELLRFGSARVKRGSSIPSVARQSRARSRSRHADGDRRQRIGLRDRREGVHLVGDGPSSSSSARGCAPSRDFGPLGWTPIAASSGPTESPSSPTRANAPHPRHALILSVGADGGRMPEIARAQQAGQCRRPRADGRRNLPDAHFLGSQSAELFMQKLVAQPKRGGQRVQAPAKANKPIFYAGKRGRRSPSPTSTRNSRT